MNWDDPGARAALIESVGPERYAELQRQHFDSSTVAVVNGYSIRPVMSARFGRVFMVDGLACGHSTLAGATKMANDAPPNSGETK
jgi:hypothetical protein